MKIHLFFIFILKLMGGWWCFLSSTFVNILEQRELNMYIKSLSDFTIRIALFWKRIWN